MSDSVRLVLWVLGGASGVCVLAGLIYLSIRAIGYRVTPTHLKVTWLGVPVRRVRLGDIRHIGNKPVLWAERWASAPFDLGRLLVIRRKRGIFKNFIITPARPYEFRFSLFQAIKALTGESLRATEWEIPQLRDTVVVPDCTDEKPPSGAGLPGVPPPSSGAK